MKEYIIKSWFDNVEEYRAFVLRFLKEHKIYNEYRAELKRYCGIRERLSLPTSYWNSVDEVIRTLYGKPEEINFFDSSINPAFTSKGWKFWKDMNVLFKNSCFDLVRYKSDQYEKIIEL